MSGERALCLDAELTPQGMTHRLIAPRKLRLSCQLGAHVTLLGDCETDVRGAVEADQKLESSCLCARALCATGEALELTDEIPLDVGEGEVRVIGSEGTVRVVEARPTEEGVVCQGEVFLKILITREGVPAPEQEGTEEMHATEGEIETVNRRISFSQTVRRRRDCCCERLPLAALLGAASFSFAGLITSALGAFFSISAFTLR